MNNDYMELPHMNYTDLCQKCRSAYTEEITSRSFSTRLMQAAGYQLVECKNCGHRWKAFLPMQPLLNMVYLLLAAEIIFLLTGYYMDLAKYWHGIFP